MTLPTDSKARKDLPLARGCLDYFPDAIVAVAALSQAGNDKHNGPGAPLHWSREKSSDHADCIMRHLVDRGKVDEEDGILHDVKVAWRALAMAQLALEKRAAPEITVGPTMVLRETGWVPIEKFEKYADPEEDPWVKGYKDWEGTLRFPAGPKAPSAEAKWVAWPANQVPTGRVEVVLSNNLLVTARAEELDWVIRDRANNIVRYRVAS